MLFKGRTSPAVDRYGGVVVPMRSDGFDELNESAAGLRDAVLGPGRVVEVADQNVVAVLRKSSLYKTKEQVRHGAVRCPLLLRQDVLSLAS